MIGVFLDPNDLFLITFEMLELLGLGLALILAFKIYSRYPDLTSQGWREINFGLASIVVHAVFDVLDTLTWDVDEINDWLNIFDGLFFIVGLLFLGIGIWKIAHYGAELWGL